MKLDWSPEDTQWLIAQRGRGVPYRQIAAAVGRSVKAVRRRMEYVRDAAA